MENVKVIIVSDSKTLAETIQRVLKQAPGSKDFPKEPEKCPKCGSKALQSKFKKGQFYCSSYKSKGCDWTYFAENRNN